LEYFKIDGVDFSQYVSALKIDKKANYNSQTNAAGNTVVDFINTKRIIEVEIIPLAEIEAATILDAIEVFNVELDFRNPTTQQLELAVNCIIPENNIEYYTIQQNNVMLKGFTLSFVEL
jgi:hypothetical protein